MEKKTTDDALGCAGGNKFKCSPLYPDFFAAAFTVLP